MRSSVFLEKKNNNEKTNTIKRSVCIVGFSLESTISHEDKKQGNVKA